VQLVKNSSESKRLKERCESMKKVKGEQGKIGGTSHGRVGADRFGSDRERCGRVT
jgi:hypothetical protein